MNIQFKFKNQTSQGHDVVNAFAGFGSAWLEHIELADAVCGS